jgi:hypothetical protein
MRSYSMTDEDDVVFATRPAPRDHDARSHMPVPVRLPGAGLLHTASRTSRRVMGGTQFGMSTNSGRRENDPSAHRRPRQLLREIEVIHG